MNKEKTALCICPPKQIGSTLRSIEKMILYLGCKGTIVVEESTCQAQRAKLLEACKEALGVLTEPGIMDVDEWKGWRKLTVAKLKMCIAECEKGG